MFPGGAPQPDPYSNLDVAPNQVIANLVVVGLGPDGRIDLANELGETELVADVAGWFGPA